MGACLKHTPLLQEILHVEGLHENAAQRLHKTMKGDAAGVTFENLVIFMASVVKGPSEMAAHLTYELLVAAKSPEAQGEVLEQHLHALIAWVTGSEPGRDLSKTLAQGAMRSTEGSGFRVPAEFMQWCKGFPAVSAAVVSLLDLQGRPAPSASAKVWELLFNGQVNGASFNTFMGKAAEKGPAMVLVWDKKGHLFGGYAAEGWSKHGQFYGSALSFIFSLAPAVARFRASGANDNMLWCGQGFSQLPNGIGWGGKAGYSGQGGCRPAGPFEPQQPQHAAGCPRCPTARELPRLATASSQQETARQGCPASFTAVGE
ncbi:hypothetical protein CVIRNUC_001671 [Coccomyxa viridis]|uniref:TLDc domain-containing protein n=1 Tax=Coccomyxa viridis TaxID=1274662 RepID=A0AAV1HTU6_9CHLO|nr:hypothetical protein CVIRNUC_001671 [Coccomyxa viridis]